MRGPWPLAASSVIAILPIVTRSAGPSLWWFVSGTKPRHSCNLTEVSLMLEMKLKRRAAIAVGHSHAVGVALQEEPGESLQALLGVPDLVIGRPAIGKLEGLAPIADLDVEIELVE